MIRIVLAFGLLFTSQLWGQENYELSFNRQKDSKLERYEKKTFESKDNVLHILNKIRNKDIKSGYVLASIDSILWNNNTANVTYHRGDYFEKLQIDYKQEDAYLIKQVPRINERLLTRLPFDVKSVGELLNGLTHYLNNNGYPFSKVFLKVKYIEPTASVLELHIEKGPLVKIKSIELKGEPKVNKKYISNFISIQKGDLFNNELMKKIGQKIEQIQFVEEIKKHELLFTPDGAQLFLYLESVPVSLINGIVGIQPNPVNDKTTITGDIRLKLLNVLKRGEKLDINWKSLQPATQELNLQLNFPFLFNTPFGIDTKFNLYKQDSTFLTTDIYAGVQFFLQGKSYITAFYNGNNSNLLSGASSLPSSNLSSVSTNRYGLGFLRQTLDYLPNPSKGFTIESNVSIGQRKSRRPSSDSTIKSTTFLGEINLEAFIPLASRHIFRIANSTKSYYAPAIFQNELFRFGGLTSQRGFNEKVLRATTLTTFTAEYRFLVDKNSHAFAFFDQTFYENTSKKYVNDHPFGFGLGFSFGTNIGIFSISYALGKQFDNPIQLRDGKVHFGYVAYF